MSLNEYFENTRGTGVLATSGPDGTVDTAIYARPHVVDDSTVAFIMAERLSYANVQSNPHAAFLFREEGPGYSGRRLHLTKTREEEDTQKILALRRRTLPEECQQLTGRHLVYFHVDKVRPLVGD